MRSDVAMLVRILIKHKDLTMNKQLLESADLKILELLQANGRLTNQEIAERIGMSASPCWRRIKRLEESGVITGYHAKFDRHSVGLGVMAFVRVSINSFSVVQDSKFGERIKEFEQVVACYQVAGEVDFLLQVVAKDLESYESAMVDVRRLPGIGSMHTMFVLTEIKAFEGVPVYYSLKG